VSGGVDGCALHTRLAASRLPVIHCAAAVCDVLGCRSFSVLQRLCADEVALEGSAGIADDALLRRLHCRRRYEADRAFMTDVAAVVGAPVVWMRVARASRIETSVMTHYCVTVACRTTPPLRQSFAVSRRCRASAGRTRCVRCMATPSRFVDCVASLRRRTVAHDHRGVCALQNRLVASAVLQDRALGLWNPDISLTPMRRSALDTVARRCVSLYCTVTLCSCGAVGASLPPCVGVALFVSEYACPSITLEQP
jgi:hypothetical protein